MKEAPCEQTLRRKTLGARPARAPSPCNTGLGSGERFARCLAAAEDRKLPVFPFSSRIQADDWQKSKTLRAHGPFQEQRCGACGISPDPCPAHLSRAWVREGPGRCPQDSSFSSTGAVILFPFCLFVSFSEILFSCLLGLACFFVSLFFLAHRLCCFGSICCEF